MTAVHASQARIFANASHVSGRVTRFAVKHDRAYDSITSPLSSGMQWIPGFISGGFSLDGIYDSGAGTLSTVAQAAMGIDNGLLATVCPAGATLGALCFFGACDPSSLVVDAKAVNAVTAALASDADNGIDAGVVHHTFQAETVNGNGAAIDNGAATTGGGTAMLHLTAYAGLTNITVKIQHSPDNVAWSDLAAFTLATGTTAQRASIAGAVNRYTRALWTVTGAGSASFIASFARR